jgi:hypothetical protein
MFRRSLERTYSVEPSFFDSLCSSVSGAIPATLVPDSAAPSTAPVAAPTAAPVKTAFIASFARVNIPLDLLFAAFLVPFLLDALFFVEAFFVAAFFVEARLVVLLAAARFLVEALVVFPLAAFLVPFLALREAVDFFADRLLLAFLAVDLLRAFVVGILSSGTPSKVRFLMESPLVRCEYWCEIFRQPLSGPGKPTAFATKQRPFIAEEALPVVDYALVFPPGLLKRSARLTIFCCSHKRYLADELYTTGPRRPDTRLMIKITSATSKSR